jgi:hypothetical protein
MNSSLLLTTCLIFLLDSYEALLISLKILSRYLSTLIGKDRGHSFDQLIIDISLILLDIVSLNRTDIRPPTPHRKILPILILSDIWIISLQNFIYLDNNIHLFTMIVTTDFEGVQVLTSVSS